MSSGFYEGIHDRNGQFTTELLKKINKKLYFSHSNNHGIGISSVNRTAEKSDPNNNPKMPNRDIKRPNWPIETQKV